MFKNQLKTVLLLGGLAGLMLLIGGLLGGRVGLVIGLVIAIALNFFSYWFSDKIALKVYRAKPADKKTHHRLYEMVEQISRTAHLPMPKVYIIDMPQANAFATGRNPKNAAVAVTTGIMQILNEKELRGVLAHEIGHIKNKDILISSIAATIAAVISYVAMMARFAAIFGGMNRDNNGGSVFEMLALAIVAPFMAMVIQFAISRSREYLADETGARLVRDPHSLADALLKIEKSVNHYPMRQMGTTESTAHLFIENPFKGGGLVQLFSTHPSTKERVKRLRSMTF